jgi:hypothetical protein
MSTPISAIMHSAARLPTPVMVSSRSRAGPPDSHPLAELQRRYPDAYQQRYADELARARAAVDARVEHQAAQSPGRAPYRQRDATAERHAYTTARYRALAWVRTLDQLSRLHPDDFQARYRAELARTAEGQDDSVIQAADQAQGS